MATQKFKPGDKVKFTQKAKDRFDDIEYWHYANYPRLDLDGVYTIERYSGGEWPSYVLEEEGTPPYVADYLLEPAEAELSKAPRLYAAEQTKKKNMTKKDFILALVQAILPDQDITYEGCKPYARVHTKLDVITVKCPKDKEGNVNLTLSPYYGDFEETDIELVTNFLEQNCDLACGKDNVQVTDNNDLVMCFADYPWHMIDEIKSSTLEKPVQAELSKAPKLYAEDKSSPCDDCKVVRKLQAEIQRLKYELDQAKAEKSQTKASPRKGEPWAEKFDLPGGGHGIAFGFEW